jgi:threonine aldolase
MPADQFLTRLEEQGIKAASFGPQMIRFVTHLDVDDAMITRLEDALAMK